MQSCKSTYDLVKIKNQSRKQSHEHNRVRVGRIRTFPFSLDSAYDSIVYASVNSSCAQQPPGLLRGICPPCQSRGWGICKFCAARGHSWAFDTHVVSLNFTGKKADWLICQGQEKLKRFVKACSWFYACISSLLIEPELHSEIGSYRRESTFFGYWIKFLLILFEEHPFIFIKLFITYNLTALYYFNVNNFTSIPKL